MTGSLAKGGVTIAGEGAGVLGEGCTRAVGALSGGGLDVGAFVGACVGVGCAAGKTGAGSSEGAGVGVGVARGIVRGGIVTPAASSTGPSASGVGVGVPLGGKVKSCTRCCCANEGAESKASAANEVVRVNRGFISAKLVKRERR